MFGNKHFDMDDADNIIIDGVRYVSTPGLCELIFKRIPDDLLYTEDDMNKYKSMLLAMNAHKHKHQSQGRLLSNRGYKYKYVITPLMSITSKKQKKKSGKGLPQAMILTTRLITCIGMIPTNWWIVYDCSTLRIERATTLTTTRYCRSRNFAKLVLL